MGSSILTNIIWRVQNCESTHGERSQTIFVTALKKYLKEPEQLEKTWQEDLTVGSRIEVYWPLDSKYYPGIIAKYDKERKKHIIE